MTQYRTQYQTNTNLPIKRRTDALLDLQMKTCTHGCYHSTIHLNTFPVIFYYFAHDIDAGDCHKLTPYTRISALCAYNLYPVY